MWRLAGLSPPQPQSVSSSQSLRQHPKWEGGGMVRVMDAREYASMTESAMTDMENRLRGEMARQIAGLDQRMDQGFRQIVDYLDLHL